MWRTFARLMLCVTSMIGATSTQADIACTLVHKIGDPEPVFQQGDLCDAGFSPASTFKLPLALFGFEDGILRSVSSPEVAYSEKLNAPFKS